MTILAIETSCDETAAAVVTADKNSTKVNIISNVISSSLFLHAKTGGIIPDVAAREQVKYIIPTIDKALNGFDKNSIDAIAVTVGPGLIGSLLVGVETAKTLSYVWQKPIIPVNHLFGHIYANFIRENSKFKIQNSKLEEREIKFPAVCLIVSGGHTDLVVIKSHKDLKWIGGTKDDAAGEAFDKVGRLLDIPYPSGPLMEKLASNVNTDTYNFPRPMMYEGFDFSFSGLKSAAFREIEKIKKAKKNLGQKDTENIANSLQNAIIEVLIKKSLKACLKFNAKSFLLGGGVAANQALKNSFENEIKKQNLNLDFFIPSKILCTDNAAMIGAAAYFNNEEVAWEKVNANPQLYFD